MFTLPPLPYDYSALEPFIDEETMRIHHDKHHGGYVDNLNKLAPEAKNLEELLSFSDQKIKNNAGGHFNHSLFWTVMAPDPQKEPSGKLLELINSTFGDFPVFKEKFTAAGMGRFGSGWAWLTLDKGKLIIVDTPNQDNPLAEGKTPILGLDVWEHAHYLRYKNVRADYIAAWWNVVNWKEVEKRFNDV